MSPTRIIRPNPNAPAGEIGQTSKRKRKSVAAVIRPVPTGSGLEGSLRLDQANENVPKHHQRAFQLDDYVDWLNKKLDRERLTATTIEARSAELEMQQEIESELDPEPTKPRIEKSRPSVLSDAELARQIDNAIEHAVRIQKTVKEKPSSKPILRFDGPQPGPSVLPVAHVAFDVEDGLDEAQEQQLRKPLTDEETENFVNTISRAIASVLTDQPEAAFEQKIRSRLESELLANAEAQEQIKEDSLIDELEVSSEEQHSNPSPVADTVSEIEARTEEEKTEDELKLAPLMDEPFKTYESTLYEQHMKQLEESVVKGPKEIPTDVAAWDVEDFRWPTVSNQMIVSCGEAVERLYNVTSQVITGPANRLAITGLGRGNGTTTIAISLGRWAAASGKKALLIDADISNPNLSRQVGLAPNMSWVNTGKDSLDVAEVIVRSQKSGLCVMPMAPIATRATWPRFIYDNLGALVDYVQPYFDLIVMDMGPATQLMDELSNAGNLVDATMLVHDGVDNAKFRKTKNLLKTFGLEKLVVTQNRIQQKSANVA